MPQPWAFISNHGLFTHTNHVSSLRIGLSTVTWCQRRPLHSQATNASARDPDLALYAAKEIRLAEFLRKQWSYKIPQNAPRPVLQAELIRVQEERMPVWRYTLNLELPGGNFHKFSNINPNPHKAASILHSNVLASFLQQTPVSSPSQRQRYSDFDLMLLNFTKSWMKHPNATSFPILHYERLRSGRWKCVVHMKLATSKSTEVVGTGRTLGKALAVVNSNLLELDNTAPRIIPVQSLEWASNSMMLLIMSSATEDFLKYQERTMLDTTSQSVVPASHPSAFRREPRQFNARSGRLLEQRRELDANSATETPRQAKSSLPLNRFRKDICDMVLKNTYTVIAGTTGSGNATEVAQMLLNHAILESQGSSTNIFCTQPRIEAQSVAARLGAELQDDLGGTIEDKVMDGHKSSDLSGAITYCSISVLLNRLRSDPEEILNHASHIIVDDVHERDIIVDTLLMTLKKLLRSRQQMNERTPKIVLISATQDVNLLTEYFSQSTSDGLTQPCPSVNVQDRLFQVRRFFLEDIMKEMSGRLLDIIKTKKGLSPRFRGAKHISKYIIENAGRLKSTRPMVPIQSSGIMAKIRHHTTIETTPTLLAAASITHILKTTTQGAILVFLPGLRAIKEVALMLRFYSRRLTLPICDVHALHQLPKEPLNSVPKPAQPDRRKVILATKIAETSIDISDIAYVIDSGLDEVSNYNQFTGAADLRNYWISKANSRQRAGRAAGVSDGRYYALFSKSHWNSLREREIPPIQRQNLQHTCLNVKNLFPREKIGQVLAEAIEPPQVAAIDAAIADLTQLGALTKQEDLTPLGVLLSRLPVDPAIGKMVILGIIFRCYEPMLILASANGTKLTNARLKYDTTRQSTHFQDYSGSDAVALLDAFQFASAMEHREDFAQLMRAAFLDISEFRSIQSKMAAIKSVLVREFKIILSHQKQENLVGAPLMDIQVFFEKHNENSTNLALIKALSLATYPDHLAFRKEGNKFSTSLGDACMGYCTINNPSTLERMDRLKQQATDSLLYSYSAFSMSTMRKLVLENTTRLSPFAIALFSRDAQITERKGRKTLMINKWLTFDVTVDGQQSAESTSSALEKLMNFRRAIDVMLTNAFASLSGGGSRHSFLDPDPRVSKLVAVTVALLEQNLEVPQLAHLNLAGFDWNFGQDELVGGNWWVGAEATSLDKSSGGVKV